MAFQQIDLQVRESSISGYTVSLFAGKDQIAEVFLRHSEEIRALPAALEAAVSGQGTDAVVELSRKFHSQVFQGPIERAFQQVRGAGPVRLRVRAEPPEIASIPWESLDDGTEPLSVSREIAFSRLPMDAGRTQAAPREADIGVLVATAEVGGSAEADAIESAFTGLRQDGLVHLVTLRGASFGQIAQEMATGRYRVVAFVAPGPVGTDGRTGFLRFAGQDRRLREHPITEVAPLLYSHRGLRFLLLSAGCRPELGWRGHSFEALIRLCFGMKVSAALSMPHPFQPAAYTKFLRTFFEGAIGGHALDVAAGAARRALRQNGGIEYALPVVYSSDPFCLRVMEGPPQKDLDELAGTTPPPPRPAAAASPGAGAIGGASDAVLDPDPMAEGKAHSAPTEELLLDSSALEEEIPEEEAEMEASVQEFAASGDWKNQAAALDHLGRYQLRRGRARRAISTYQEALVILKDHDDERSSLPVMLHLADALRAAGERDRSIDMYKKHLEIAERLGDDRRAAISLTRIGERHAEEGNLETAVSVWRRALKTWQSVGEDVRAAELLIRIGAAQQSLGEFEEAIASFEGGLYIQRQREDLVGQATSLNNLGNVATRRGKRDEAVTRYSESLELFRQVDSLEGIASVCHNLSNISFALGDHRRCLELALETRSIAAERGLRSLTESTSRLLGKLKKKLGPEAYAKLEDAVRSGSAS